MSKDKLVNKRLAGIEKELAQPIPDVTPQNVTPKKVRKVKKMATKKKAVKKVKKAPVKKATVKKVTAKKVAKPSNAVSLSELAKAAGLDGQQARYKLRKAGIEKPEGRFWEWTRKSDIKKVEKALAA